MEGGQGILMGLTAVDVRCNEQTGERESGGAAAELLATVLYVRRGPNEAAVGTLCEWGMLRQTDSALEGWHKVSVRFA